MVFLWKLRLNFCYKYLVIGFLVDKNISYLLIIFNNYFFIGIEDVFFGDIGYMSFLEFIDWLLFY